MRPGEENLDGPPIHGNTRLEVIWTAIPAIIIVGLVHLRLRRPARHREGAGGRQRARRRRHRPAVHLDASSTTRAARSSRPPQLYLPDRRVGEVRRQVQGRHPRLLGPGVPHEDRRGARASRRTTASRRPSLGDRYHGRLRRALRPRPRLHAPDRARRSRPAEFDAWVAEDDARPARRRRRRRRRRRGGRRQAALHQRQRRHGATACGACHTLADAGTTGSVGPDLDKVLKGKDAAFIKESIVDPDTEIAPGFQAGIMPPNYGETLSARSSWTRSSSTSSDGDEQVRTAADARRAARTRLVPRRWRSRSCGVAFSYAVTIGAARALRLRPAARRRGGPHDRAARGAAVLPRRPRLLRLLVLLGRRAARRAPRTTPATARTCWKDYFRVNTDHKVIGIQYVVTSFFFLFVGGLMAMLMRAELAAAGPPVRRRQHLQRPLLASTRRC